MGSLSKLLTHGFRKHNLQLRSITTGITTNAIWKIVESILENAFTSYFPAILNEYTSRKSSREMFYLYDKMTGSVEALKIYLSLQVRM